MAAREAFDGPWRRSTVTDRAALLGKIADLLQRDREQLATRRAWTPARR
jgi:NAD-dependent aldehyde dehydrogenases